MTQTNNDWRIHTVSFTAAARVGTYRAICSQSSVVGRRGRQSTSEQKTNANNHIDKASECCTLDECESDIERMRPESRNAYVLFERESTDRPTE